LALPTCHTLEVPDPRRRRPKIPNKPVTHQPRNLTCGLVATSYGVEWREEVR
jgi:hypothetical protein